MAGVQRELEATVHRMELENTRLDMALQHERDKSKQLNRECGEARQVCRVECTLSQRTCCGPQFHQCLCKASPLFTCRARVSHVLWGTCWMRRVISKQVSTVSMSFIIIK